MVKVDRDSYRLLVRVYRNKRMTIDAVNQYEMESIFLCNNDLLSSALIDGEWVYIVSQKGKEFIQSKRKKNLATIVPIAVGILTLIAGIVIPLLLAGI